MPKTWRRCTHREHLTRACALKRSVLSALTAAIALCSTPALASMDLRGLAPDEWASLHNGGAIERRFELPHQGAKYLAGVSYAVLNQPCAQLTPLFEQPVQHLAGALPATREVQYVGQRGELTKLRIVHGNATMQGEWGALLRVSDDGLLARFWLDTEEERDVEDVFGYFRLSAWEADACLVTAAIAVDPGDGLLASLFRSMIHRYLVSSAARIQRYVQRNELAASSANVAFVARAQSALARRP